MVFPISDTMILARLRQPRELYSYGFHLVPFIVIRRNYNFTGQAVNPITCFIHIQWKCFSRPQLFKLFGLWP